MINLMKALLNFKGEKMRLINLIGAFVLGVLLVACGSDEKAESTPTKAADSNMIDSSSANLDSNATLESNASIKQDSNATLATTNAESSAESSIKTPQDLYKKCIACHGEKGDKVAPGSVGDVYLADISKDELIKALKGYRAKNFSKGGTFAIMYLQANGLSDEDIGTLADYITSFKK